MSADSIIDSLAALPLFQSVPRTELEWLAERGEVAVSDGVKSRPRSRRSRNVSKYPGATRA